MRLISSHARLIGLLVVLVSAEAVLVVCLRQQGLGSTEVALLVGGLLVLIATPLLLVGVLNWRGRIRRLNRLAEAMESASGIDTLKPLPELAISRSKGDQFDRLNGAFNALVRRNNLVVEMLRGKDTARRDLFANVSHELRTPLAVLGGYVETLLMRNGSISKRESASYLEIAMRQIELLSRMADELFELAQLDEPHAQLHRELFHPSELAQDVVQKFDAPAARVGVRIERDLNETLPLVEGNVALLERLLSSILRNALQHTPEGGHIAVTTKLRDSDVCFTIRDSGPGVASMDAPFIFDHFNTTEGSRDPQNGGYGLDLAIAMRIADLHSGNLNVENELGVGTSFIVTLPVSSEGLEPRH